MPRELAGFAWSSGFRKSSLLYLLGLLDFPTSAKF
jgi:hypothetical protein